MSFILSIICMLVPCILLFIAALVSSSPALNLPDREKASPFECGFDPKNTARTPFSTRYFLLAVVFLVFDIEIILLMPLPVTLALNLVLPSLLAGISFLIILILGLLHEWHEGSLEW
nr:NADH dehydrogenase subunit 3 [Hesionides sp. PA-2020]